MIQEHHHNDKVKDHRTYDTYEQPCGMKIEQDYSFNKKNYEPGKTLEVNPAAFGISFEKASKPQGIINQALKMPGRTLNLVLHHLQQVVILLER